MPGCCGLWPERIRKKTVMTDAFMKLKDRILERK